MIRLSRRVLCLDWDRRFLRLVVARVGGGRISLEDAHAHRVPTGMKADDPAAMGKFIAEMLRLHKLSFKSAILDVPRDRAVTYRLTMPPTPVNEVADAVRFQAMKELPFQLDESEVDFVITQRDGSGMAVEAWIAAVRKSEIARLRDTCAVAGLRLARLGLRPYANLMSVRHLPELAGQRVLLVDVGPSMTEIDVIREGKLAFTRAANVSVPDPSGPTGTSEDSRILTPADLEAADDFLEAAANELLLEVTRTLQAYRASESDAAIDRILIGGGTGIEPQLLQLVSERFSQPCSLFNPTAELDVASSEAVKLRAFSAVLGLAWGLSREGLLELDFLNPKRPVPRRQTQIRRARLAGLAAATVLVAAGGYGFVEYQRGARLLRALEALIAERTTEVQRRMEIQNRIDEVADWSHSPYWSEQLLRLTDAAVDPGKKMLVGQIAMDARTAMISMKKISANHYEAPIQYERSLNELRDENGLRVFKARQGTWREMKNDRSAFTGSVDMSVDLVGLREHIDGQAKRERERKQRLRDF